MLDFGKLPVEKAVHLLTKVLPGFALLFLYNSKVPGTVSHALSLPFLGYATRIWLLVAICFTLGYSLSTVLKTVISAAAGALGALWASWARRRHPYNYQIAPWRDSNWRSAYKSRFGPDAPKDITLVLPLNAAQLLEMSQPLPPNLGNQQHLAEQITMQINSDLKAAIDAITNDIEWRMCYERIKLKVVFDQPLEAIEEVMGGLDSDFSLASALVLLGTAISPQFRAWWLLAPAIGWLIVSVLRFCAKAYQFAQPWNTLTAQIDLLKSGKV